MNYLRNSLNKALMVPKRGLEPPHLSILVPETSASTNSAIWAIFSAAIVSAAKAWNFILKAGFVNDKTQK